MTTRTRHVASAVARATAPLAMAAAIALGGCGRPSGAATSVSPASGAGTLITEEQIARMSVRTAWDVVRLRAPRFTSGVSASGRPTGVRIQEQRSINADETPLLVVDGVSMSDIDYLQQIPASDLRSVRILNAEAAEPIYGLRAAGGAIVVETKRGT